MCTKSSSLRRTHVGHGQDSNPILNLQSDAQERNAVLADMALPRFGYDFALVPKFRGAPRVAIEPYDYIQVQTNLMT